MKYDFKLNFEYAKKRKLIFQKLKFTHISTLIIDDNLLRYYELNEFVSTHLFNAHLLNYVLFLISA